MIDPAVIEAKIRELEKRREQLIAAIREHDGALAVLRELLSPPAPTQGTHAPTASATMSD